MPRYDTVTLVGGSRDGERIEVLSFVPVIYIRTNISLEEEKDLRISDTVLWKAPEDVYIRSFQNKSEFIYDRTVRYKPE